MLKRPQRSYSAETRHEAVELADRVGASAASQELNIPIDTLYTWISRARNGSLPLIIPTSETQKALTQSERIKALEQENHRLRTELNQVKREHQILEEAAAFFASRRKKSGSV